MPEICTAIDTEGRENENAARIMRVIDYGSYHAAMKGVNAVASTITTDDRCACVWLPETPSLRDSIEIISENYRRDEERI